MSRQQQDVIADLVIETAIAASCLGILLDVGRFTMRIGAVAYGALGDQGVLWQIADLELLASGTVPRAFLIVGARVLLAGPLFAVALAILTGYYFLARRLATARVQSSA